MSRKFFSIIISIFALSLSSGVASAGSMLPTTFSIFPIWPVLPPIPPIPPITPPTTTPTSSSETTLFFGVPGANPNILDGYGISTADIDGPLHQYTGFGPNYTRDVSNQVFGDLGGLKLDMQQDLINAINSIDGVSVSYLNLSINPIHATISQSGTSVNVRVGDLDGDARVNIRPGGFYGFFCPTLRVTLDINDISVSGSYNVNSGSIENSHVGYILRGSEASCSGLLGPLVDYLFISDARVRREIDDAARDSINEYTGIANMQTLFSIADFLQSARAYGDIIEDTYNSFPASVTVNTAPIADLLGPEFPQSITIHKPQVQGDISDQYNEVIDTIQQIVDGFPGTGLQVDISVFDGRATGATNQISFLASHQSARIESLVPSHTVLKVTPPGNSTSSIEYYSLAPNSQTWSAISVGNVYTDYTGVQYVNIPRLPDGTRVVGITQSGYGPSLRSLPVGGYTIYRQPMCFANGFCYTP